jgi:LysR family transcriptional regulator for metE and metH
MFSMHNVHMNQFQLSREDFELVVAIQQQGTVTQAAEHLHLSQSALSHHLRGLEDRLGEPLFQRFPRKMVLTPLGEEFLAIGRQITLSFREAEQRIVACAKSGPRILRMATECYTSYNWLPSLIREQNQKESRAEVRIVLEATARVREALNEGELDVAILNSSIGDDGLTLWPLFRDEMVLVVSSGHPFANMREISAELLGNETLLLNTAPGSNNTDMKEFFALAKIEPKSVQYIPFTDAIIQMVGAGLGVAPLARWLIEPYLHTNNLSLLRLGRSGIHRNWRLAAREGHPREKEFASLAKALRTSLRRQMRCGLT